MYHFTSLGLKQLFKWNHFRSLEEKCLFGGTANNSDICNLTGVPNSTLFFYARVHNPEWLGTTDLTLNSVFYNIIMYSDVES